MTNRPTPPRFQPVPAIPIRVEFHRKGECRVRVAGRVATGPTLREAIAAAQSTHPADTSKSAQGIDTQPREGQ
jgi:hypothetical protein